jgi:hypothetical protein
MVADGVVDGDDSRGFVDATIPGSADELVWLSGAEIRIDPHARADQTAVERGVRAFCDQLDVMRSALRADDDDGEFRIVCLRACIRRPGHASRIGNSGGPDQYDV